MEVVLLHKHPEFLQECCEMLNDEWPRSKTARMHSLTKSSDDLPCSLLLLDSKERKLIGHSRIGRVIEHSDACWIESVVIRKDHRGRGIGKMLMDKTEQFAKSLGFCEVYLNTRDKQDFYAHIGYAFCEPICLFHGGNSKLFNNPLVQRLQRSANSNARDLQTNNSVTANGNFSANSGFHVQWMKKRICVENIV